MLADFTRVVPQTSSMVVVTYRPEYRGRLAGLAGAQTIALAPLEDSEISTMIAHTLGSGSPVAELLSTIVVRAAGNPSSPRKFSGTSSNALSCRAKPGAYTSSAAAAECGYPRDLQTTIAARIDRLPAAAKRTLNAASVIGMRFDGELLESLGIQPHLEEPIAAELIDLVTLTPAGLRVSPSPDSRCRI